MGCEHVLGLALLLSGLLLFSVLHGRRLAACLNSATALPGLDVIVTMIRLESSTSVLLGSSLWAIFAVAALQYSMHLHGLYDRHAVRRPRNELLRFVRSAVVAGILVSVAYFLARPLHVSRPGLVFGFTTFVAIAWSLRMLSRAAFAPRRERLLLLGSGAPCVEVARLASALGAHEVLGRVGEHSAHDHVPLLGGWSDLATVLDALDTQGRSPDLLLVASAPPSGQLEGVVRARLSGAHVLSAREFSENLTGEVLEADPGIEFLTDATAQAYGRVSRLMDSILALLGLALAAPILAVAAAGILVSSGRPILFTQERIGFGGRPYRCLKLRTMRPDAEAAGPSWSPESDARVEPLGRHLRRWRIDEIPQLVNILRGDMAFVGPRPEQPHFVARLTQSLPYYSLRHLVRPGLTGWAQVRAPYGASEDDSRRKLRFDLFYIKHRSPYLDLAILFDTIRVVLQGRGR